MIYCCQIMRRLANMVVLVVAVTGTDLLAVNAPQSVVITRAVSTA